MPSYFCVYMIVGGLGRLHDWNRYYSFGGA